MNLKQIEVNNLTTNKVEEDFLIKAARSVLKGEGQDKFELSIALVGQGRIRALNKKYRGKNKATDVLSFRYNGSGEVAISLPEIKKNAKKLGLTFEKELIKVLIHGILHILGYDHEKSAQEEKDMEEKQRYYILNL